MLKKFNIKTILFMLIIIFTASCVTVIDKKTVTIPNEQKPSNISILKRAETAYSKNDYQTAAKNYALYLNNEPNPQKLEVILTSYGLAAEKSAYYEHAIKAYTGLIKNFPNSQYKKDIEHRLLNVYIANNKPQEAENLSQSLLNTEENRKKQEELKLSLAYSFWLQKKYTESSKIFLNLYQIAQDKNVQAKAQEGLISSLSKFSISELENLNPQLGQNYPAAELNYILIYRYVESKDIPKANQQIEYFYKYFRNHPLEKNIKELVNTLASTDTLPPLSLGDKFKPQGKAPAPQTDDLLTSGEGITNPPEELKLSGTQAAVNIVALLPFSEAKSSKYAQEIFNGMALAAKQNRGPVKVNIVKLDTKGSGETAAQLINSLANDNKATAIVGPFLNREALAAAQAAQKAGIPMVAISQREDLPSTGSYIFRLFLTPKHQVEAAVDYSKQTLNHSTYGLIYPSDTYGQTLKKYYEQAVLKNNSTIVNPQSYDVKAKNWGEAVKTVTGGKVSRKVSANYQAATGFTVMFIPDSVNVISQIFPLMAFHDVTKMQYIGTSLWLSDDLLKNSARYIQNVIIPIPISKLSQNPTTSLFYGHYQQNFGEQPEQLAAYGYDATLAIIEALNKGAGTKEELANVLRTGFIVDGATGKFKFNQNGEYEVKPMLLTVSGQDFKLLRDTE